MNTATGTDAKTRERGEGTDAPTILHYVPEFAMQDGRKVFSLCGQVNDIDMGLTGSASLGGDAVICPMCEMKKERLERRYHDPDEPILPLAAAHGLSAMMEKWAGLTDWEAAEKAGLDPRQLNRELNSGSIPVDHMAALAHACGTDMNGALAWIDAGQKAIEQVRAQDGRQ